MECEKCLLTDKYPGIKFNDGVCNFCADFKPRNYKGFDQLRMNILENNSKHPDANPKYDCVLGFSGGRDSTYLLWFLTQKLGLRVLGVFADNGFIPKETLDNIHYITKQLNVKLEVFTHNYLKKSVRHHLKTLQKKPDAAMVGFLCVGCRFGMDVAIYKVSKSQNVYSAILGTTPYEGMGYKRNLLKKNGSFFKGYLEKVINNPNWIMNPFVSIIQYKEFRRKFSGGSKKNEIKYFKPFGSYIDWDEKEIERVLDKELQWKRNPNLQTSWRGDCYIAPIKGAYYREHLGYNDIEDHLSSLIRAGKITKKEASERIKVEATVDNKYIDQLIRKIYA